MGELPPEAADEAERLTRLARAASDPDERETYRERRDAVLTAHGFTAWVRDDDDGEVLVCRPSEWVEDGTVRFDRTTDTDRAVERRLSARPETDDWEALARHNLGIAERVGDAYGEVHGANALAFADFMNNHRARRIESATDADRAEFRTDFFVRNTWPTDEQKRVVETSLSLVESVADAAIDEGE